MAVSSLSGERVAARPAGGRLKFIIGGVVILGAIVYLVIASSMQSGQYFLTVAEMLAKSKNDPSVFQRESRISGAVLGDTIQYDAADNLKLTFQIADMPGDQAEIDRQGGLAAVLEQAVKDPSRQRLTVVYHGPRPDLLKDQAQAIVTGKLGQDGIFYANSGQDGLLLKCPTRYEEAVPGQVQPGQQGAQQPSK